MRWRLVAFAVLASLVALAAAESASAKRVAAPRFVRNIDTGETGWFSSPGLVDLNRDGRREIVAPFYSTFVFDASGRLLGRGTATDGRVYAPGVVADLDSDGVPEIVVGGNEGTVAAYNLVGGRLRVKPGWPASTCSGGQCPEARGMAAADLDGNGSIETVVTTTNTATAARRCSCSTRPEACIARAGAAAAWPRYNASDRTFNGIGNHGYGAYGENVGIGNLDDDPQLEIVVTFDNHQINVFNHDGTSVLASRWYTNRESGHEGRRLGWGQFIRWLNPRVEARHYHRHAGPWPDVRRTPWLQWTASPPSVADLDRDGRNEVIGLPNVERGIPYRTQRLRVHGARRRAARRRAVGSPAQGVRNAAAEPQAGLPPEGDWYPPSGIPAPTVVNIAGDRRPEIVASVPDGSVYA